VPGQVRVALASCEHTDAGVLDPRGYWEWAARRYERKTETNALTHRTGRVTEIIPVLAATVSLPMRRALSIVVAVGLAGAAVALQDARWTYDRAYGPIPASGRIGRTVTEPHFTIQVEQVVSARTVRVPEGDPGAKPRTIPATGVFVVVIATVAARRSPVYGLPEPS
jgi:hypothetical protein